MEETSLIVPFQDVLSWTFAGDVSEEEPILLDAADPEHRRLSKSQIRSYVRELAHGLRCENGGRPLTGDAVCVHAFNDILYPVLFLGIIGSGAAFTGSNPAYKAEELAHHFRVSRTRFVITEQENLPVTFEACKACDIPQSSIFVLDKYGDEHAFGLRSWRDLLRHGESDWEGFSTFNLAKATTAVLSSTSGTSGVPKMAARSHYSIVSEGCSVIDSLGAPYKQKRLIGAPFFHAFASPLGNLAAIRSGVPTFVMRRFSRDLFLDIISKYEITETTAVPPIIIDMLAMPPDRQKKLKSLQTVWCGGAPLDIETQRKAVVLLGRDARIVQVWGMTETGWITTFFHPYNDDSGSVGRLIPGFEAKLLDENGCPVTSPDARGEVCVRGPGLMDGYLGNVDATRSTIDANGWLQTGDVGRIQDGKLYIVDRKKDLIKVRGWQVSPAELEGNLLLHPSVADAAVIGVTHPGATSEIPRAYIVGKQGVAVSEQDVKAFLLSRLAKYKVIDCEVVFLETIPRSPSGKILKRLLKSETKELVKVKSSSFPAIILRRFSVAEGWAHRGLLLVGCLAGTLLLSRWRVHSARFL